MSHFAVKRLAAVEIAPDRSNQHELNADTLRRALGFPAGRSEGKLQVLACTSDEAPPQFLDGTFTLYDARENHATRTEYRLYYRLPGFVTAAKPGDMLVLGRGPGMGIQGVVARPGTAVAKALERLLLRSDHEALRRMVMRESQDRITSSSSEWVLSFLPALSETELTALARSHPLFVSATTAGRVPATREIAGAGRDLAAKLWGSLPPDDFIHRGLEAESALYFSIESALGAVDLKALVAGGQADLNQVLSWAMSIQQSRKSRRGQSLQHHFSFLLSREAVPYSAQARTEGSETPDFLIPGEENYHDPDFPATRLRMVACKSTVRERWGQILKEANRIPEKHVLTVDENLAADVITKMRASNLRVFVPAPIILDHYGTCAASDLLGTVNDLLVDLKATL